MLIFHVVELTPFIRPNSIGGLFVFMMNQRTCRLALLKISVGFSRPTTGILL